MTSAVAFDFPGKRIDRLELREVAAAVRSGRYCWIDLDDSSDAETLLDELNVERAALERIERDRLQGQIHVGRSCIDCTFVESTIKDGELALNTVHVVLGDNFTITVHDAPSPLLEGVRETYEDDFYSTAESGGFLLFEIADHLISGHRDALAVLSEKVERIQAELLGDIGDEILADVSELTRSLLDYRNAVVTARETLDELATRRSPFVRESTQPYLDRQTVPLERLAGDAATERAVLSESLNLYMGLVSHRTNKVVNRLTIVSMIFLPLNFLAAVYGMNFQNMPELGWRHGYLAFWLVSAGVTVALLFLLMRRRWF